MVEWVGKMLKRRDGKREDWKRITKRAYAQSLIETEEFNGHVTLLHAIQVSHPLNVHYEKEHVCILDDGYMWLQQFPSNAHHAVTTMFDADGNIVQWYIDICLQNGFTNGSPWWEDLFLDIVLLPSGDMYIMDTDELEDALSQGVIDKKQYELAWGEVETLKAKISTGDFELIKLARHHKDTLMNVMNN